MRVSFTKMNGAGNDFVVIDNRRAVVSHRSTAARKLCNRRFGIGADGLLLIELSDKADYKMNYYNADGSYGGMCGNGGRCIALYSLQNRIAGRRQEFEALGHVYQAKVSRANITLRMKDPKNIQENLLLPARSGSILLHSIDTGSPHTVVFVNASPGGTKAALDRVDVIRIGKEIRRHRQFKPEGTNVNFVHVRNRKTIQMRTYERGVEDETLACGTGAVASAITSYLQGYVSPPVKVITRSNEVLIVDFACKNGRIKEVTLSGSAETSFKGEFDL